MEGILFVERSVFRLYLDFSSTDFHETPYQEINAQSLQPI